MAAISSIALLTPSELILLNGEKFAPPATLVNKVRLLHTDQDVSGPALAQAILVAAFLACKQGGTIRMEPRQNKAMLGLKTVTSLYVEPLAQPDWPEASLEAAIPALAAQLRLSKGRNEVSNVVYAWLRKDDPMPWMRVIDQVKEGLAQRGLLEVEVQTKIKILVSRKFSLPESTRLLLAGLPVEPVQQMLYNTECQQPVGWKLLNEAVKKGINQRTEQADTGFDG